MIDIIHALKELDRTTPQFFRREALEETDGTSKIESIRILRGPGDPQTVQILKDILKVV